MKQGTGLPVQIYDCLRRAIISGEYLPGAALSENRLAEQLGSSRTPVRQALQALAQEGFIEIVPTRGCFVTRLSLNDVRELFQLRELLEGAAAGLAATRAVPDDIAELERLASEYDASAGNGALLGTEFHRKIIALAGNRRLATILESLNAQIVLTRVSALRLEGRQPEVSQEHRAILDAIKARDPDLAEHQARAHVRISYAAALRCLERGP